MQKFGSRFLNNENGSWEFVWRRFCVKSSSADESRIGRKDRLSEVTLISGPPVEVGVTMYVLSISSLSEVQMVLFRSYAVIPAQSIFNQYMQSFRSSTSPQPLTYSNHFSDPLTILPLYLYNTPTPIRHIQITQKLELAN